MSATALNAESEDWQVSEDEHRPVSLVVQLRRQVYVLPYSRFVCAAGDNSQVKMSFASHLVTVSGHGLTALLANLAVQRVFRLIEPLETQGRFARRGPSISSIAVEEVK